MFWGKQVNQELRKADTMLVELEVLSVGTAYKAHILTYPKLIEQGKPLMDSLGTPGGPQFQRLW